MLAYFFIQFILFLGNLSTVTENTSNYISSQKYSNNLDFVSDSEIILDNLQYNSIILSKDSIPLGISDFMMNGYKYKNIIFISLYKDESSYKFSKQLTDKVKENLQFSSKYISYRFIGMLTQGINEDYIVYILYN